MFRFSLPLQDLVNVELQPEIYFRCVCDLIKRTVEPQPEIYFRCVLFKKKENWSTWSCSRRSTSGACA